MHYLFFEYVLEAYSNFPSFFAGARAWARGTGPGPGPGPAKKDGNVFFSARVFRAVFPYIWPLAGPNIAKKGGPLPKLARVDRQTHFGTFNFWIKHVF